MFLQQHDASPSNYQALEDSSSEKQTQKPVLHTRKSINKIAQQFHRK
jgi:hypothetical protein